MKLQEADVIDYLAALPHGERARVIDAAESYDSSPCGEMQPMVDHLESYGDEYNDFYGPDSDGPDDYDPPEGEE